MTRHKRNKPPRKKTKQQPRNRVQVEPVPYCPKCGAQMVFRFPTSNWKHFTPFWGCSHFPECRGTREIDDKGRPVGTKKDKRWYKEADQAKDENYH